MKQDDKEKRIALLASVCVHAAVFAALAAAGVFSFLQDHSQARPIDVTIYQEDSLRNLPRLGDEREAGTYESPQAAPAIDETFTQDVEARQKKIEQVMAEQGLDEAQARQVVQGQDSGGAAASPAGSGSGVQAGGESSSGNGSGTGKSGSPDGLSQGDGLRPATKAKLVSIPDVNSYYPEELRRKHVTGTVTVGITISADGSVASAVVTGSSGHGAMDEAALQIAYQCRYEPARNTAGQPVPSERELRIPFTIE